VNSDITFFQLAYVPLGLVLRPILASGVLNYIGGELARDEKRFFKYASDRMDERIADEKKNEDEDDPNARKDMMHYILQAKDPQTGKCFTRQQLNAESGLLISTGADTTSTTFAAVFFYVLHNPRVLSILLEEIRTAFAHEDEIQAYAGSKLTNLVYLRAVIDETLRLSPPAPAILPREVLERGITIDDEFIPEGTVVGVPPYVIHRNPDYYPEPAQFYPERWIVDEDPNQVSNVSIPRTKEAVQTARQAFTAFSHGTRGCVGRQLAYYELHTAIALLLYQFDIRLAKDPGSGKLLKNSTQWREGVVGVMDPEDQKEDWREERKRRDEFQLFDRFLADRSGPMVEYKHRY
jgi:cytochrome P450